MSGKVGEVKVTKKKYNVNASKKKANKAVKDISLFFSTLAKIMQKLSKAK